MHELITTILSHRTTHANEETVYKTMRVCFPSWEAVRDAPLPDLIEAIRTATYPEGECQQGARHSVELPTRRRHGTFQFPQALLLARTAGL